MPTLAFKILTAANVSCSTVARRANVSALMWTMLGALGRYYIGHQLREDSEGLWNLRDRYRPVVCRPNGFQFPAEAGTPPCLRSSMGRHSENRALSRLIIVSPLPIRRGSSSSTSNSGRLASRQEG